MNRHTHYGRGGNALYLLVLMVAAWSVAPRAGAQETVATTLHNLSVTGPGEIKSQTETEICKFCHVPHSAVVPRPLWGHALSQVKQYAVPRVRRGKRAVEPAPQPDGSSRLCLSCHDGTIALGKITGESEPIPMGGTQRLHAARKGYLGTDLSGSHPISFVMPDGDAGRADGELDMGIKPRSTIEADGEVRLDQDGKMQCTTCHDAHSDKNYQPGRVPHFWVKTTVTEVCLTCHELR